MASPSEIALRDPVRFVSGSETVEGHVAHKTTKRCTVVATDGSAYTVPWALISPRKGAARKHVTTPSDDLKSKFRTGDEVDFEFKSNTLRGRIERMNPSRASVVSADGRRFSVPYGTLQTLESHETRNDAAELEGVAMEAERLMALHGLAGWSFQFDDSSRRMGVCNFHIRVIGMSRQYCLAATDAERTDTILHEIAHALVGPKHHHDSVWKAAARAIGCTAERCGTVDFAPSRYIATCTRCNWSAPRNLRLRGAVCKACGAAVRYLTPAEAAWRDSNTRRQA